MLKTIKGFSAGTIYVLERCQGKWIGGEETGGEETSQKTPEISGARYKGEVLLVKNSYCK